MGFVVNLPQMRAKSTEKQKNSRITSPIDREELENEVSAYGVPRHVDYLDELLQLFTIRRYLKAGYKGIIVEEPPRHGKSELCSHYFPAWYLGAFPDERMILASYEADFAALWGRKSRNTLERWGKRIFGVEVNRRSSAADRWDIEGYAGGMITAGVGGAITGRGADVLIIDDPVKNAQEANSKVIRDRTWEWYQSTARTRLEPHGIILLIMTRWHEDDLAGRLLAKMDEDPLADKFMRVHLPAIAEEGDVLGREVGEALWPERYPLEELRRIEATVGSYVFSALFQQRPAPKSGGMFSRDNFQVVAQAPRRLKKVVRHWDFASSDQQYSDYTAGVKMGIDHNGNYFVLDCRHFKGTPKKVQDVFKMTVQVDGRGTKQQIEKERGSAGKHVVDIYSRMMPQYDVKGKLPTGDKEVRAGPYSAAVERHDVFIVEAPWNEEFLQEHESFPYGRNDDQVDSASGAFEALAGKKGSLVSW
jgi:predicted phage terminase large subunit-like protein